MENRNNFLSRTWVVVLLATFCCFLWGSAAPVIKIGYEHVLPGELNTTMSTILFAGLRFMIAGFLTIVVYSIARRKVLVPRRENVGRIALVCAFQTVIQYFFFYTGLSNTSGVKATVLSGASAFFAVLITAIIFRTEKLTVKKIAACVIGFAGIVVINLKGLDLNMNFTGDAFIIFSALSSATSTTLMKKMSKYEDPVIISGYQFFFGGIVMATVGALLGGRIYLGSVSAVIILIYLSILSAIAFSLWGILLKHNPVSKVSVFSFLIPVFGVMLSVIMLPESSNVELANLIITLLLVSGGIFLINYSRKKTK